MIENVTYCWSFKENRKLAILEFKTMHYETNLQGYFKATLALKLIAYVRHNGSGTSAFRMFLHFCLRWTRLFSKYAFSLSCEHMAPDLNLMI